ncbi:MAG: IS66 family insertion sequence element accessory protein TnpB [Desulfobacteraceae bacterium]|nr:IS66 family insertion sequence element accessory protein TnpB [Desulfobacteraceae bacterium]
MRKSFDSLYGLILNETERNPLTGDVFIFVNKTRNKLKLLHWEAGGFVIYYKRLESGTLKLPDVEKSKPGSVINWWELVMIIEGIQARNITKRKRFSHD